MSRETSLVKNTAVIALGKICTQFISFILLPLYTTLLSTSEYGTVDLFNTYISLLLPIATLMVEQGAFRYLITRDEEGITEEKIVTSSLLIIVVMNVLFIILGAVLFRFYKNEYRYYLIPILVTASILNWCLQMARGYRKLTLYSAGSFVSAGTHIILNVVLIAVLEMGARGMLIATAIGNICGALFLFLKLRIYKYIKVSEFDKEVSKKMLAYSAPLIPNTLSLWIINSSDRTIVNTFLGISANGILAVSHKFSAIYQTLYSIFQLSWHEMGTVHWNDSDRDAFFSKMMDMVVRIFSSACIVAIAVMSFAFKILIRNPDYSQAYMTIPIYMVAVLFNIMIGLMGVVYVATKKTKEIAKTTIFAGIINVAVHLILIKSLGLYAAAISTLIAYLSVTVFRVKDVRKYLKINLNIKHLLIIGASLVAVVTCYYSSLMIVKIVGLASGTVVAFLLCRDSLHLIVEFAGKIVHRKKVE